MENVEEIWKLIPKSNYEISNFGRIRSVNHIVKRKNGYPLPVKGRIIIGCLDPKGYLKYRFVVDGRQQTKKIHRLVAESFIENKENKPQVNHKDGNKKNNKVTNLEWVTNLENARHANRIGLRDHLKNAR